MASRIAQFLGIQPGPTIGINYALRTTCAAVVSLLLARVLHIANPIWAVVSSVVVIMPELEASIANAALRVIANIAGASAGLGISFLHLPTISSLILGLALVALLCRLIGVDAAARTASVTVVIVLLRDPFGVRVSSVTRVALVMLGCLIALFVTVIVAQGEKLMERVLRSYKRGAGR